MQSRATLEITRGVRLSYARWLIILGLLVFYLLDLTFKNQAIGPDLVIIAIGAYAVFNLIMWVISLSFGKGNNGLVATSLFIDLLATIGISTQFNQPQLFTFPYIAALLIMILVGVWQGVGGVVLVALANIGTISLKASTFDPRKTDTVTPLSLELLGVSLSAAIFGISIYILTSSAKPITRLQDELLEEAVAKANTSNLTELQNRVKAVYRVARTLNRTLDPQKVIEGILVELETVFDVSVGAVLLFDDHNRMRVVDGLRLSPSERQITVELGAGVIRETVLSGEPDLITDHGRLQELYNIFPSLRDCRSVILMPMRGGSEVFGLVLIASRQENAYSSQDLEWVVALTSHPVVSLQNAKLYNAILEDRNKVIRDIEEIRHNLARNLHDGPAQAVAAFSMQAEFIRRLIKADPDKAIEELSALGKQALQTSKEIRTLLFELRPIALESQGLEAALEQYAGRFPMSPDDPKVHFSTNNFNGRLSPNVETTVFMVMQEAVNNARKHAKAKNMWLNLEMKDGYLIATAQDDGKGFDMEEVQRKALKGSLGTTNMRERAALVGGGVDLRSMPGRGTIVILRIPLNETNTALSPAQIEAANANQLAH